MSLRKSLLALPSFFSRPCVSSWQPLLACQGQPDQLKSRSHNQRNTVWPLTRLMFVACLQWWILHCIIRAKSTLLQIMTDSTAFVYPKPRKDETAIDDYHGTKVLPKIGNIRNSVWILMLFRWRTHSNGWRTLTAVKLRSSSRSKMLCPSLTLTLAR